MLKGGICKRTYYEKRFGVEAMEGAVGAIQNAFEKEGIHNMLNDDQPIAYSLDGVACSSLPGCSHHSHLYIYMFCHHL